MEHRRAVLERLIRFEARPALLEEVRKLPWDSESDLVQLRSDDVIAVLQRHLAGELDRQDLETWADLIEGREDIGLESRHHELLRAVIYELANPTIMDELTHQRVVDLIGRLGAS